MKITIPVHNNHITAFITKYGVHILNDDAFHKMMQACPATGTELLATHLLASFRKIRQRELKISRNSLIVEIWGHYFSERILLPLKKILPASIFGKIIERIVRSLEQIDCSERRYDGNRFIWDMLSPFKRVIGFILFRNNH